MKITPNHSKIVINTEKALFILNYGTSFGKCK